MELWLKSLTISETYVCLLKSQPTPKFQNPNAVTSEIPITHQMPCENPEPKLIETQ